MPVQDNKKNCNNNNKTHSLGFRAGLHFAKQTCAGALLQVWQWETFNCCCPSWKRESTCRGDATSALPSSQSEASRLVSESQVHKGQPHMLAHRISLYERVRLVLAWEITHNLFHSSINLTLGWQLMPSSWHQGPLKDSSGLWKQSAVQGVQRLNEFQGSSRGTATQWRTAKTKIHSNI